MFLFLLTLFPSWILYVFLPPPLPPSFFSHRQLFLKLFCSVSSLARVSHLLLWLRDVKLMSCHVCREERFGRLQQKSDLIMWLVLADSFIHLHNRAWNKNKQTNKLSVEANSLYLQTTGILLLVCGTDLRFSSSLCPYLLSSVLATVLCCSDEVQAGKYQDLRCNAYNKH